MTTLPTYIRWYPFPWTKLSARFRTVPLASRLLASTCFRTIRGPWYLASFLTAIIIADFVATGYQCWARLRYPCSLWLALTYSRPGHPVLQRGQMGLPINTETRVDTTSELQVLPHLSRRNLERKSQTTCRIDSATGKVTEICIEIPATMVAPLSNPSGGGTSAGNQLIRPLRLPTHRAASAGPVPVACNYGWKPCLRRLCLPRKLQSQQQNITRLAVRSL